MGANAPGPQPACAGGRGRSACGGPVAVTRGPGRTWGRATASLSYRPRLGNRTSASRVLPRAVWRPTRRRLIRLCFHQECGLHRLGFLFIYFCKHGVCWWELRSGCQRCRSEPAKLVYTWRRRCSFLILGGFAQSSPVAVNSTLRLPSPGHPSFHLSCRAGQGVHSESAFPT